jgi:hypothetical protein
MNILLLFTITHRTSFLKCIFSEFLMSNAGAECLAFLLCVLKDLSSNLGRETGYPDRSVSWASSSLAGKCGEDALN